MKYRINTDQNSVLYILSLLLISLTISSCKKFLEIDSPISRVDRLQAYENDITATQAVTGIYVNLYTPASFLGGGQISALALSSLSADELQKWTRSGFSQFYEFDENRILPSNTNLTSLWGSIYKTIYQANDVIEGLESSKSLSLRVRDQLKGEALFCRAFANFYLVNLFGDAPLVTNTSYEINSGINKSSVAQIYSSIIGDLKDAKLLLQEEYISPERVRPSRFAASALLARVYLFTEQFELAEVESSQVIDNPQYTLVTDLSQVFVNSSMEAIWQLMPAYNVNSPSISRNNTKEAEAFVPAFINAAPGFILTTNLLNAFEVGDGRRDNWIAQRGTVFFPFKYKVRSSSSSILEYSIVLRLAEQYLIRAEARARTNNIPGAQEDINIIRERAFGIASPTTATDLNALLIAIEQERRVELFAEQGSHRWFDLKRWEKATEVLGPLKGINWQETDVLYPIPQDEINKTSLKQNDGY